MKLITQEAFLKVVDFFGAQIEVPEETRFLAASPNGTVTAYVQCKPELVKAHGGGYWWGADDCLINSGINTLGEVAKVDLEGMDWTKTCVEIE